jgi:Flp pilus assembly pilin Flp
MTVRQGMRMVRLRPRRAAVAGHEVGQGGLEYALVAGVVVVAVIIAYQGFDLGSIVSGGLQRLQDLVP